MTVTHLLYRPAPRITHSSTNHAHSSPVLSAEAFSEGGGRHHLYYHIPQYLSRRSAVRQIKLIHKQQLHFVVANNSSVSSTLRPSNDSIPYPISRNNPQHSS